MKHLVLFTTLYIIMNIYLIYRINWWEKNIFKKEHKKLEVTLLFLFQIFVLSNVIGPFLPGNILQMYFLRFTNIFLAYLIYFFILLFIFDIYIWISKKTINYKTYFSVLVIISIIISVTGLINANDIKIKNYSININKETNINKLNIVMLADTHFGFNTKIKEINKLVNKINELNPDIVLFAGDIINNDINHIENIKELETSLKNIKSKYGTYGVYGNHDASEKLVNGISLHSDNRTSFITKEIDDFLNNSQINILKDDNLLIDNSFYLLGRRDERNPGTLNNSRLSMEDLTKGIDLNKPTILIDHEPTDLKNESKFNIDLVLSGHTHNGQTFPLNLLMPFIYENHYGHKLINNTHTVTTSGVGTYGPPIRFLTNSEIVNIQINFN